ncbi:MAG: 1-acyl-sn-glycerol-3-phosphate acyltransferase, partial [Eubacteriales bacterium]|nr:1-acyl-sn-glycerol-3-phosphate acyltransferase [Eubacteriales bacterium]
MKKTIYYDDALNDDFAFSKDKITPKKLGPDYKYIRRNLLWQTTEFLLYRFVATPLLYMFCIFAFGLKVKNSKAIRKLKTGCFLYANHTNGIADSYIPTLVSFPKRSRIITASDSVSIPYISGLVQMLGAVALPDTPEGARKFLKALRHYINKKQTLMIYPEAHIWPFYNRIRPFTEESFSYPIRLGVPAVAVTVVYRRRKLFKKLPPLVTVFVSDPIYPPEGSPGAAR